MEAIWSFCIKQRFCCTISDHMTQQKWPLAKEYLRQVANCARRECVVYTKIKMTWKFQSRAPFQEWFWVGDCYKILLKNDLLIQTRNLRIFDSNRSPTFGRLDRSIINFQINISNWNLFEFSEFYSLLGANWITFTICVKCPKFRPKNDFFFHFSHLR